MKSLRILVLATLIAFMSCSHEHMRFLQEGETASNGSSRDTGSDLTKPKPKQESNQTSQNATNQTNQPETPADNSTSDPKEDFDRVLNSILDRVTKLPDWAVDNLARHANVLVNRIRSRTHLLDNLRDRVGNLSKEDMILNILTKLQQNPEIRVQLEQRLKALTDNLEKQENFEKALLNETRQVLNQLAIKAEEFYRKEHNLGHLASGIHYFINYLNSTEVVAYIKEKTRQFPELRAELQVLADKIRLRLQSNHLEDYVANFTINELRDLAIAAEKYHRERKGLEIAGGVHDYVHQLNRTELYAHIRGFVLQYPELGTPGFLEALAFQANLYQSSVLNEMTRKALENLARKLDHFSRELVGMGNHSTRKGISDRFKYLKDSEIISFTERVGTRYPALVRELLKKSTARDHEKVVGGLEGYLRRLDRPMLEDWALRIRRFIDNLNGEITNRNFDGHLLRLSNEDLLIYIQKQINMYPELKNMGFLDLIFRPDQYENDEEIPEGDDDLQ